jgi:hypothetical protein
MDCSIQVIADKVDELYGSDALDSFLFARATIRASNNFSCCFGVSSLLLKSMIQATFNFLLGSTLIRISIWRTNPVSTRHGRPFSSRKSM